MRRALIVLVAACGGRGPEAPVPHQRAPSTSRALPDDACLQLGRERNPAVRASETAGSCRLPEDRYPPTGRSCIAKLADLGRDDLEVTACYRARGAKHELASMSLVRDEAEVVFVFDDAQCWVVGAESWTGVAVPIKAYLAQLTGCDRVREDYEF